MVNSADYKVVVTEGVYKFNNELEYNDTHNKYLAKIEVYMDGTLWPHSFRGSSLPDSALYYQLHHVDGKVHPPADEDILNIYTKWENDEQEWERASPVLSQTSIDNLISTLRVIVKLSSAPVLWSGEYKFEPGVHKSGYSPLGQPWVLKLFGKDYTAPYDGRNSLSGQEPEPFYRGGYIATINQNLNQGFNSYAAGINVHRGQRTSDLKRSEGCITISPDDWEDFIALFPYEDAASTVIRQDLTVTYGSKYYKSERWKQILNSGFPYTNEWLSNGHTGILEIIRLGSDAIHAPAATALPPQGLRVFIKL